LISSQTVFVGRARWLVKLLSLSRRSSGHRGLISIFVVVVDITLFWNIFISLFIEG